LYKNWRSSLITPQSTSTPDTAWSRHSGPHLELDWLREGAIVETIPQWFIDFFVATRNIGAIYPGQSDNCTMTTVEDNWCLYRLVQLVRPGRSLEIGIMRGSSSITIGRALLDAGIECEQFAVDIDPLAVEAAGKHFVSYNLGDRYRPVVADSREFVRTGEAGWNFVFLDGDHLYDTVAIEFAETYNRAPPGGLIVLHDTGSARWGTNEDPGTLFFGSLDDLLGESASMTWLDSTSCSVDMKLRTSLGYHTTLPLICAGIAVGYGGLGIVQKLDDSRKLTVAELMSRKPASRPVYRVAPPPQSPLRRAASRAARLLGI
jgi:hypothetical protein